MYLGKTFCEIRRQTMKFAQQKPMSGRRTTCSLCGIMFAPLRLRRMLTMRLQTNRTDKQPYQNKLNIEKSSPPRERRGGLQHSPTSTAWRSCRSLLDHIYALSAYPSTCAQQTSSLYHTASLKTRGKSFMEIAQRTNITAGTAMDTRQATFGASPEATIGLNRTDIMKILGCVT